jgi:hypothetical protein
MRLVALLAAVLALGGSTALATATALSKTATIRVIVVHKTGSVSPGRTSPVSVLCSGKHTAISWGFQAITPVQGKLLAPKLVSAAPIVRKSGGLVGWIARFTNANAVPLGVRVSATCAEGRGIEIRTTGSRRLASAAQTKGLVMSLSMDEEVIQTSESPVLETRCPRNGVPTGVGMDIGDWSAVESVVIPGPGYRTRLVHENGQRQDASLTVACLEGDGVKIGIKGVGPTRSGQVTLDASGTHTLTVPAPGNSFFFHCLKGVNVGIAYSASTGTGSAPPLWAASFPRPVATGSETLDPKVRTIAFLNEGPETKIALRAMCLKTNGGFKVMRPGVIDLIVKL